MYDRCCDLCSLSHYLFYINTGKQNSVSSHYGLLVHDIVHYREIRPNTCPNTSNDFGCEDALRKGKSIITLFSLKAKPDTFFVSEHRRRNICSSVTYSGQTFCLVLVRKSGAEPSLQKLQETLSTEIKQLDTPSFTSVVVKSVDSTFVTSRKPSL